MIMIGILGISLSAIFVRYSTAPSPVTASYRLLWTVLMLAPVVLGSSGYRKELLASSRQAVILCAVSGIFLALHFTTWFESLKHTSVASSTAIVCTEVIWVALGYFFFLKGSLSKMAVCCITITVGGSLMIALSDYSAGQTHLLGDILSLAAAMFVAVYTLIGRVARSTMSTTVYTFLVYSFCALTLLILTFISGDSLTGYGWNPVVIGLLLGLCSTILGHSIFSWCLKYFSPAFVSASKLCEPVIAALFAIVLFGEIPSLLQILGGGVIIGGVLLYSKEEAGH